MAGIGRNLAAQPGIRWGPLTTPSATYRGRAKILTFVRCYKPFPDYRLSSAPVCWCKPGTCCCFCGFERMAPAGETKDRRDMKPTSGPDGEAASANITRRIEELGDWRGETLAHVRQLIHDADPAIQEEWKWV